MVNTKTPHEIIDQLPHGDALAILKALAGSDPKLAARIVEMALARLSRVDAEEVAGALYDELEMLKVEDVWDRADATRYGFVEPSDAAGEMLDEVLNPFLAELTRYQRLGLNAQANGMCMGLLEGLHAFEYQSTSEFKDWAYAPAPVLAEAVVDAWKSGSPKPADVAEGRAFVEHKLGGWQRHLI
jgi:hypothetical protein